MSVCKVDRLVLTLACFVLASCQKPSGSYEGIPTGFDFPADENRLEKSLFEDKVHELRRHAWLVFAGLTQPAEQKDPLFPRRNPRRFETWYLRQDTFAAAAQSRVPFLLSLQVPGELAGEKDGTQSLTRFKPQNNVLFNREAYERIRAARQPLYLASTLVGLCGEQANESVCRTGIQEIEDFPRESVVLKVFFGLAKRNDCTQVGSWDFQRAVPGDPSNTMQRWPRQVFVEIGPTFCDDQLATGGKVVPLSDIYSIPVPNGNETGRNGVLSTERLRDIDRAFPDARAGDYLVLLGMHVITREIKNWVWATFWWHDFPNRGPFSEDRPA